MRFRTNYLNNFLLPRLVRVLLLVFALVLSTTALTQDLTVAAAADLQFAMQDISSRFAHDTGKNVKLIYGSSGNFAQQLRNGAPFDMFFSANLDYPRQLQQEGLVEPDTLYSYAKGKIVLWVPKGSKLDLHAGLQMLASPNVGKIAIANPEHAPYGKAAIAALQAEHVYEKVKNKLVLGESVSQAASFVASGAADAGIIALSLALSPNMKDKGQYLEVPASEYPAIEQACVILRSSKNKDDAWQFLQYMRTKVVRDLLREYGFDLTY